MTGPSSASLPRPPGPRLADAAALALEAHTGQMRKGTSIPYVSHVLAVCAIVLENGGDEDEAVAALLHDVVEDGGGRPMLERIRAEFGARVAMIVDGCTDAYVTPKPPWAERKRAYLEKLESADDSVVLVSAADKLHNARAILSDYRAVGPALWDRFTSSPEETVGYYVALASIYGRRLHGQRLADDVVATVGEILDVSRVRPTAPDAWGA